MDAQKPEIMTGISTHSIQETLDFEQGIRLDAEVRDAKTLVQSAIAQFGDDPQLMELLKADVVKTLGEEVAAYFFDPEMIANLATADRLNAEIKQERDISCGVVGWKEEMRERLLSNGLGYLFDSYRQLQYYDSNLGHAMQYTISQYFSGKKEAKQLDALEFAVEDVEIDVLRELAQEFVLREDLIRPFGDQKGRAWNINRTFSIDINGTDYECMMVISPDSGFVCSFQLGPADGAKKDGGNMKLGQSRGDKMSGALDTAGLNRDFTVNLYEMASHSVDDFYRLLDKQADIQSGKRFGKLNLFGIMLKLNLTGEIDREDFKDDPVAAYALMLDMNEFQFANGSLNAGEYALMACDGPEEFQELVEARDKAQFMHYVVKGYMKMCTLIMAEAAGGPTNIMDGLDPDQKARLSLFSSWGQNGDLDSSSITSINSGVESQAGTALEQWAA